MAGGAYVSVTDTPQGPGEVFADVHIFGKHLVRDELMMYPFASREPLDVGTRVVFATFRQLRVAAADTRFEELTVVSHRAGKAAFRAYNRKNKEAGMNIAFRTPEPLDSNQVQQMTDLLRAGTNLDHVIRQMRDLGWNKIDCIRNIRDHTGLSLGQAKDIVHLSPAWADRYESDEAFHDSPEQAFHIILEEDRASA